MIDDTFHLCNLCLFSDDCDEERIYPVTECELFVDIEPAYFDGDAWREWMDATYGFGIGTKRGEA